MLLNLLSFKDMQWKNCYAYKLRAIIQGKAYRRPQSAVGEHQGNPRSRFLNLGTTDNVEIILVL